MARWQRLLSTRPVSLAGLTRVGPAPRLPADTYERLPRQEHTGGPHPIGRASRDDADCNELEDEVQEAFIQGESSTRYHGASLLANGIR